MNETQERFERMLARLRTDRDELRVKAHLAGAEAKEEWEKLEHKWNEIESRMKSAGLEARDASGEFRCHLKNVNECCSQNKKYILNDILYNIIFRNYNSYLHT